MKRKLFKLERYAWIDLAEVRQISVDPQAYPYEGWWLNVFLTGQSHECGTLYSVKEEAVAMAVKLAAEVNEFWKNASTEEKK